MIRIVIADDHTIVREGLKLMLDHQPGIEVIGTASDGQGAYDLVEELHPDIVDAIRTVKDGGVYVSKEMLPYLVQGFVNRNREEEDAYLRLTEREIEILTLIAKGYGNKEISEKLFMSV